MRLVLDACVLYPSIMRSVLLAAAGVGAFEPVWSPRLLEEWRRAALRRSPLEGVAAEGEIALIKAQFPRSTKPDVQDTSAFWLPDENDIHVLALAAVTSADGIVTVNKKDFPGHILNEYDLTRHDPDALLTARLGADPDVIGPAIRTVIKRARQDLPDHTPRSLLKKARLPRLGKAMDQLLS